MRPTLLFRKKALPIEQGLEIKIVCGSHLGAWRALRGRRAGRCPGLLSGLSGI